MGSLNREPHPTSLVFVVPGGKKDDDDGDTSACADAPEDAGGVE